jgi:hypothetical protein
MTRLQPTHVAAPLPLRSQISSGDPAPSFMIPSKARNFSLLFDCCVMLANLWREAVRSGAEPAADGFAGFGVIANDPERRRDRDRQKQSHAAPHPSPEEQ